MSRRIFEHRCHTCDAREEYFVPYVDKVIRCSRCGGEAHRVISAPKLDEQGMGLDPGFPTAYDRVGRDMTKRHKGS